MSKCLRIFQVGIHNTYGKNLKRERSLKCKQMRFDIYVPKISID
jgi:hypothetical protein